MGTLFYGSQRLPIVIDGESLPKPKPQHEWQDRSFDPGLLFNPFIIVGAIVWLWAATHAGTFEKPT